MLFFLLVVYQSTISYTQCFKESLAVFFVVILEVFHDVIIHLSNMPNSDSR